MECFSKPTRTEQENLLIRFYFGIGTDYLHLCIERAYLDFSRTLHGIGRFPRIHQQATTEVEKSFIDLRDRTPVETQEAFDKWHRATCALVCSIYKQNGYDRFYIGQAQKWLNMSLKYIYVIGDERLPGYNYLYQFCHIPLDNIIIGHLRNCPDSPKLSTSWSRIIDYDEYLRFQVWIRNAFAGAIPLAVEFRLWQQDAARR